MSTLSKYLLYVKTELRRFDRSRLAGMAALVCALGLTLASAGFAYSSVNRLHEAFNWVRHTDRVILQMTNIEKGLLAADSAARAQVYAGNHPDQTGARITNNAIRIEVERLALLVADNPDQTRRILHLRTTIATRAMASPRREGAQFHRLSAIRAEIQEMQNAERKLLQDRTASEERATVVSLILAALTGLLAFVLGALGIYLLTMERASRRHIELELMRIQRLNTMSLTTMALAHEINQPLAAASNYLASSLRLASLPNTNVPAKFVDISTHALEQVQRAGKIIGRLRCFIAKNEGERTTESPSVMVDDAISLLGTIDTSVKIETHIDTDLPRVCVDRIQLQQVFINLVRNGIEALAGEEHKELLLSAVVLDSRLVCFSVHDNGPGLSKAALENLFKPFESTKSSGMGLGLTICKAIITSHGGRIWAAGGLDGGTTINFTLPALPEQMAA